MIEFVGPAIASYGFVVIVGRLIPQSVQEAKHGLIGWFCLAYIGLEGANRRCGLFQLVVFKLPQDP